MLSIKSLNNVLTFSSPINTSTGDFNSVTSSEASIDSLTSSTGTFNSITSNVASIDSLTSSTGTFDSVTSSEASIDSLTSSTATFDSVTSSEASIDSLTSSTGTFETLISSNISSNSLNEKYLNYTQTFQVLSSSIEKDTTVVIEAWGAGAQWFANNTYANNGLPGYGGYAKTTLTATKNGELKIVIGRAGSGGIGGSSHGDVGYYGANGGGASYVYFGNNIDGYDLQVVAGGGGGGGGRGDLILGGGGGNAGENGLRNPVENEGGFGGGGGTLNSAGLGGLSRNTECCGSGNNGLGPVPSHVSTVTIFLANNGGNGGVSLLNVSSNTYLGGGGGGGGGYYGGGGGAADNNGGGGGGGSNYSVTGETTLSNGTLAPSYPGGGVSLGDGNGYVRITITDPAINVSADLVPSNSQIAIGTLSKPYKTSFTKKMNVGLTQNSNSELPFTNLQYNGEGGLGPVFYNVISGNANFNSILSALPLSSVIGPSVNTSGGVNYGVSFYYKNAFGSAWYANINNHNPIFTGQHLNFSNTINYNEIDNMIGLIVVSTGEYKQENRMLKSQSITSETNINDALPLIDLSSKRNQKSVFGVISNWNNESPNYSDDGKIYTDYSDSGLGNQDLKGKIRVNGLGEGSVWICNINGDLENGDYITTCEIPGFGMKQDDDIIHTYTVAKITCDCTFDLNSTIYKCEEFTFNNQVYRKAFVGCVYKCS